MGPVPHFNRQPQEILTQILYEKHVEKHIDSYVAITSVPYTDWLWEEETMDFYLCFVYFKSPAYCQYQFFL